MRFPHFAFVAAIALQPDAIGAQPICTPPAPAQCEDLTQSEREAVVAKLQKAQGDLKAGRWVPFTLLLGAMASNEKTKVTPRDAFLSLDFARAQGFTRDRTSNLLWQPVRLTYIDGSYSFGPMGRVPFFWQIDVVLGFDDIQQVSLLYRPPDPH
jgi:hypothetical protein